jgi:hypothetical protein
MHDAPTPPLKREHIFSVRFTEDERDALFAIAHRLHVTPSHFVRHVVNQAIKRLKTE